MAYVGVVRSAAGHGSATFPARAVPAALVGRPRVRYVLGVVALAALYRGVAQIGYELQFAGPIGAIAWLPVGVGMGFLYLAGPQYWPGVLVGDLLANDYGALPLGSAVGQSCGNVLEVVVATLLLRRLVPDREPLASVRGLGRMLLAIGAGTATSATIGAASLVLGGALDLGAVPETWRTWWLGDSSGALIVLPLVLAWAGSRALWSPRVLEGVLVLAAVAALSLLALGGTMAVTYVVFPALILAALRLGPRAASVAVAIAAGFAIWETTRRVGPFASASSTHSVLATQLYLAVSALTTLCVVAVAAERRAFAARLAASRARLVEAGEAERRRIERNLHDGAQQRLTALTVRLNLAAHRIRGESPDAAAAFEAAGRELSAAIEELRELAHGIHPSVLTQYGLAHALRGLPARSAVAVRIVEVPEARMDETAEVTAWFVVSEAVTNAGKHAGATSIDVHVSSLPRALRVEVADDGRGGARESGGSGLQGLRDRVEAIGGEFEIRSPVGGGTRLVAVLPATRA